MFWTPGTEVYSTADNYFANGHHEIHELLISRIFVPVVPSVPFDNITTLTIITKNDFV